MISFLKRLGFIILLLIVWSILSVVVSSKIGIALSCAVGLAAFASLFKPLPKIGLTSKIYASILVPLSLLMILVSAAMDDEKMRLERLEIENPAAYARETAMKEADEASAKAAAKAEYDANRAEEAVQHATEQTAAVAAYKDRLTRELPTLPNFDASAYTKDVDGINLGVILIGAWSLAYEDGQRLPLDDETKKLRQDFRKALVKVQTNVFPKLRDAYGPAMSRKLWEADGSARTIGKGYRTIELVSVAFARNVNIKDFQTNWQENFRLLRFTRARYKWIKEASEFQYYDMEPPKDSDIVKWNDNGTFLVLD